MTSRSEKMPAISLAVDHRQGADPAVASMATASVRRRVGGDRRDLGAFAREEAAMVIAVSSVTRRKSA